MATFDINGVPYRIWAGKMAAPFTEPAFGLFRNVVKHVLANWTALQLAVQHGMGGMDGNRKAAWLEEAVANYFLQNANLERDEVEDMLEDVLSHEFDTVADDGSVKQIAEMFCRTFRMCQRGEVDSIRELIPTLPTLRLGMQDSIAASVDDDQPPILVSLHQETTASNNRDPSPTTEMAGEAMEEGSDDEAGKWTVVHRSKR